MTKQTLLKTLLFLFAGLIPLGGAAQQTKLVAWEFDTSNNQVPDNQIINATTGSGTVSFFSTGNYTVVPEDRAYGCVKFTAGSNSGLTDADWTNPEKHNNYIQAEFSTTGYQKPVVSFAMAADTGTKWRLVYSANGGESWVDAGEYETDQHWGTAKTFDNIAVNATNKEKVIFRILNVTNGNRGSYDSRFKSFVVMAEEYSLPSYNNEQGTITWPFDLGTEGQTGTYSPANIADAFKNNFIELGGNLSYSGTGKPNDSDIIQTKIKSASKESGPSDNNKLNFLFTTKTGIKFTPTKVSFTGTRYGTGSGNMDINWLNSDGTTISLATGQKPERNNQGTANHTDYSYSISSAPQSEGICGLNINIYNLDPNKELGFANIVIEGILDGQLADVRQCKVTVTVSPEGAGTAKVSPVGNEFDEGTEITLSQTKNFGYKFKNWTDATGKELSTEESFKYILNDDAVITANYEKLNTYALSYNVAGGANDYMVTLSPEPNVIDGKNMYEEGTKVTLKASSNPIMTFTNWSNGETAAEMAVTMDGNKNITASYSAVDFIAAWDFYLRGNDGRAADFAAADNDAASLVMRNAEGATSGWLDKSEEAAGGYEGRPAAVNWRTTGLGEYYWQTMVNAAAFTDIKVKSAMAYNYNAYTKYNVEYSLDGEKWTGIGAHVLEGAKNWNDGEFALPADANNKERLYIRWIADKESAVNGTESANDGIAIAGIYITGTEKPFDDGKAPELVSSVPVNNGTGASANGKIVLTFNEKVKLTDGAKATIGTQELVPTVSGMTVICEYKGLDYSTDYTFTLAGNSVSDITDNVLADAIVINFQTKVKPVVEKKLYDFVVGVDGTITEALAAANSRGASATGRYRVFITKGNHVFDTNGTTTGKDGKTYDDPRSYLTAPYVSFIGESMEDVTITNKTPQVTAGECPLEGIGNGDVLIIQKGGHDAYFQGLTMKSSMGDAHGRDIVLNDQSNRTIFKDACLWAYQDTYVSNSDNGKFYFEGGVIRGRTDYLCGKGDVYYNEVTLQQCGTGGYLAVPSVAKKYGYVFNNCYIKKETSDVTFYLGRPWGSGTPIACFINTKMDGNAIGNGWADMSGGWPKRFAEYNSYLVSGTQIDLNGRRTSWKDKAGNEHPNDPILTVEDVNAMSLANVMGQDDDWDPTALTEQASAPTNVRYTSTTLTWDNSDYVLGWVVLKNGEYVANVIEPSYTIDDATATWSVRAANEMGGLGEATVATVATGIDEINGAGNENVAGTAYYNLQGIRVSKDYKGVVIKVDTMLDGRQVSTKIMK